MEYRYDAPCGIYCGACETLHAFREDRVEEHAKLAQMEPDDVKCAGCKTEQIADYCIGCHFRDCTRDKGIEFCFECEDFPCERLAAFRNDKWPHHSSVLKNLEAIRERGLDAWLEEQAKRWSCPECGEAFSWYRRNCRNCGAALYDCRAEDKDLSEGAQRE